MWSFWLIAAGIFFIIEMATVGFLIFWLGIGALMAMFASFLTENIIVQTIVFVVTSAVLIPFTKPLADKFTGKKAVPTNTYSLIKKHGIVIADINSTLGTGLVKVNGETWSAKTQDESIIEKGKEVEILAIDGVKLIVSLVDVNSLL